jgi:hypothetical protein
VALRDEVRAHGWDRQQRGSRAPGRRRSRRANLVLRLRAYGAVSPSVDAASSARGRPMIRAAMPRTASGSSCQVLPSRVRHGTCSRRHLRLPG